MSVGHVSVGRARPIDVDRTRELERLMAQPWFRSAVAAYDREDDTHDVPYVGGSCTDWRTVVWDRHFAAAVRAGQFRLQGRPIEPRRAGKVHEATEGALIHLWPQAAQLLGWPAAATYKYPRAHDLATVAERHVVEHLGWNWREYQMGWQPFVRAEEHEAITDPPHNLLLEAYRGTPLYARLATFEIRSGQARARVATRIGARQAPDGEHYLPDPQRPGKYLMLVHHVARPAVVG